MIRLKLAALVLALCGGCWLTHDRQIGGLALLVFGGLATGHLLSQYEREHRRRKPPVALS